MINNIKDLEKVLKLCRKQGVTELDLGTVKFKLGDLPQEPSANSGVNIADAVSDNPWANFPSGQLTQEQLMFYSSGGKPEDDPYLKEQEEELKIADGS